MMALLFFLFLVVMYLIFVQKKETAFILSIITLILCVGMFLHHATDKLRIIL